MSRLLAYDSLGDFRLLLVVVVCGVLLIGVAAWRRQFRIATAVGLFVCLAGLMVWSLQRRGDTPPDIDSSVALFDEETAKRMPRQVTDEEYVSSESCQECHAKQHQSWHDSFHRTMTQTAGPKTVLAPFDKVTLGKGRWACYLEQRGDEFWVDMVHPMWERGVLANEQDPSQVEKPPRFESRVVMTTGSHRRQSYWVLADPRHEGNEVFQLPWTYQIAEQKWVPLREAFLGPAKPWVIFSSWNESCIHCHSVAGKPGLKPRSKSLDSEVAEFGIACEACHGPAGEHVRRQRQSRERSLTDLAIVNPAKSDHRRSAQICGQCHSVSQEGRRSWWTNGRQFQPGSDLNKVQHVVDYAEAKAASEDSPLHEMRHAFWKDGTARTGGREYNGLLKSACFERGEMSCTSCHSMHDSDPEQQVAAGMRGNDACLQCHEEMRDKITEHTHHGPQSPGSSCYNCHMPHTSYALFRTIRSHRIDSPSVANSVATGKPNACNLCHLDKTLAWTQRQLANWYETPMVELSEEQEDVAASLLWALSGDAAQRVIAAGSYGSADAKTASGDGWQAPFLAILLEDPYAAVRWVAHDALQKLPGFETVEYDFVAPEASRAATRRQVEEQWAKRKQREQRAMEATLIDPDGELDAAAISRLLEKRNDQRVYITE